VGEGPLHLAISGQWRGWNLGVSTRIHAGRNRLERPSSYFPSGARGLVAAIFHFLGVSGQDLRFYRDMDSGREDFANNIEVLKAALVAERGERIIEAARAARAEAELAVARAKASDDQALIAHQQLRIEKLTRQLYGPRSERTSRILDQIELQFEELESSATEDEIAAEMAVAKTTTVAAFTRKRPARKPLPEHLPRERVIVPGPTTCLCCGGKRLRKLGETVTETLESVPRQWKVI